MKEDYDFKQLELCFMALSVAHKLLEIKSSLLLVKTINKTYVANEYISSH